MPVIKRLVAVILSILTVFSCVSAFAAEKTDNNTITNTAADHSVEEQASDGKNRDGDRL